MTMEQTNQDIWFYKGEVIPRYWITVFLSNVSSDVEYANVHLIRDMEAWLPTLHEAYQKIFVIPESWLQGIEDAPELLFCGDHIWISQSLLEDPERFTAAYVQSFFHEDHKDSWLAEAFTQYILGRQPWTGAVNTNQDHEVLIRKLENYYASNYYYSEEGTLQILYMALSHISADDEEGMIKIAEYLSRPKDAQFGNEYVFVADVIKSLPECIFYE